MENLNRFWIVGLVLAALVLFAWINRYEPVCTARGCTVMDRWTGEFR